MRLPYILREATEADMSFVYNSYLLSYKNHSDKQFCTKTIYFQNQKKIIDFVLNRSSLLLAVFPEDPSEIMGFIIYEQFNGSFILHYVYIKYFERSNISFIDLIDQVNADNIIFSTHITKIKGKKVIYDPYFITNQRLLNER